MDCLGEVGPSHHQVPCQGAGRGLRGPTAQVLLPQAPFSARSTTPELPHTARSSVTAVGMGVIPDGLAPRLGHREAEGGTQSTGQTTRAHSICTRWDVSGAYAEAYLAVVAITFARFSILNCLV